jgi:hypothetical protein
MTTTDGPPPAPTAGNPKALEWRAIDCPVGEDHKLEFLFCTPGTCNANDPDQAKFGDIFNPNWFAVTVRNQRIPVIKVGVGGGREGRFPA